MKNLKKTGFILAASVVLGTCAISPLQAFASATAITQPRAEIIEWRYKVENNKLYRRQYNYSTNEWIGEWEFVGNVS
jgi:hypothetical protein